MQQKFHSLSTWFSKNKEKIYEDFFSFLRFRSVGTDPSCDLETLSCAKWVVAYLEKSGFNAKMIETTNHPVIFAQNPPIEGAKTLLIYGHYDVQPIDPLDLWKSDPFEPTLKDNTVYARGATDDKGQIFYTLVAIKAFHELGKQIPFNLKFCIEGGEESASTGLLEILEKEKDRFSCDALLVVDVGIPDKNTPAITLGARGMLPVECEISNSFLDLHSGGHGGIAYNSARAMCELLAKLWDKDYHIQIPNFYDDVVELSEKEKEELESPFDEEAYKKAFGVKAFSAEKGYKLQESNWFRPSLEINGISGGYSGPGVKTIIPAKTIAKLSFRLVPNQIPEKVAKQIQVFLQKNIQKGMDLKVKISSGGLPVKGRSDSELAKSAMRAYSEVFNKECKKVLCGASIPVIGDMVKVLKCDMLMIGVGLAEDDIHAPNEHFGLDRFEKGFLIISRMIEILGEQK